MKPDATLASREVIELLRRFAAVKAWVIGDVMLDEYIEGDVRRISPDAPVQVVNVRSEYARLGGAANVAHGLVALGAKVQLCGVIGSDAAGARLRGEATGAGIGTKALLAAERPTTRKVRVLARHQHVLRMDWERTEPLAAEPIIARLKELMAGSPPDVIVLSDYAKGVLSDDVLAFVLAWAQRAKVPVLVDPKRADFVAYRGATVVTPNLKELAAAVVAPSLEAAEARAIEEAARTLLAVTAAQCVVVTLGEHGMCVVPSSGAPTRIAASAREVYDVTGAGDTVIALLALGLGARCDLALAARLANAAAGIVVEKVGTAVVRPHELVAALAPAQPRDKVLSRADLLERAAWWRLSGKRVVFTNGCFDLVHAGHVALLAQAAAHGDVLVVGVNSDASVKRLKGPERPLLPQDERAQLLAALESVGAVVVFEEDTPAQLIAALVPDVLVKGGDYQVHEVVGRDVVEAAGGRVVLVPLVEGKSTTSLVQRIRGGGA